MRPRAERSMPIEWRQFSTDLRAARGADRMWGFLWRAFAGFTRSSWRGLEEEALGAKWERGMRVLGRICSRISMLKSSGAVAAMEGAIILRSKLQFRVVHYSSTELAAGEGLTKRPVRRSGVVRDDVAAVAGGDLKREGLAIEIQVAFPILPPVSRHGLPPSS
nr:Os03g0377201 [Ipomoea batatas]